MIWLLITVNPVLGGPHTVHGQLSQDDLLVGQKRGNVLKIVYCAWTLSAMLGFHCPFKTGLTNSNIYAIGKYTRARINFLSYDLIEKEWKKAERRKGRK